MKSHKNKQSLDQKVLRFIRDNRLIQAGDKILVAVSGGPDSVSLMYILYHLQPELKIELQVAHLNHQIRGEESEKDARYVAQLAQNLHLPASIAKRDVVSYQREHHLSLEEGAREVRYRFLAETAGLLGIDKVAVGHTQNDQVETILMHIIRGTGTQGLRGLQPSRAMQFAGQRLTVIRPLLGIRREETEEYCSLLQLRPCLDASNYSRSPLRNRTRLELLPVLQSYNPEIFEALLRISQIAQDDFELLDVETEKIRGQIIRRQGTSLILEKSRLLKLAPALQRQLLRKAISDLLGTLKDIEARHIEEILGALRKPAGKKIILPQGLIFSIEYKSYLLGKNPEELVPFVPLKGEFDITLPGKTRVPGWAIDTRVIPPEQMPGKVFGSDNDILSACFDKDKVGDTIKIRARRRGDRFQPLGMGQLKRLGEFMIDARIPQTWRDKIPILYSPQQIIWVAGWRIDERVKVTESTRQVLCLKMTKT
jgi:tRNA(Ile)-lysidine synthase